MVPQIWSADKQKFSSFRTIFCPLTPLTARKIKISKKWKKLLEILSFYTCVPEMTIMRCMVLEISSAMDRIFCHFGPFFALSPPSQPKKSKFQKNEKNHWRYYHFTLVYQKWQSCDVWFLRYRVQRTELLVILDHFLHFYPPHNPKNQNFKQMKKTAGGIIILNLCTINDNHMYGFWDIKCDRQNFLSLWNVFCPFTTTLPTP